MSTISAEQLNGFDILADLTAKERKLFSARLKERSYAAGKTIFNEGDPGGAIYFLLSGEVEISQSLTLSMSTSGEYDQRDKSIIRLAGDHNPVFGEVSLMSSEDKRTATVKALSNCRMGLLIEEDFFKIVDGNREVGYKVLRNLCRIISDRLVIANRNVLKLTTAISLILEK
ncbi:MAG: cyclic nucleotide-binding domain-containing protein [Fidelibacterota bacterium]|nr:MAG: cyclic nucleotide-binding domain-containing protein [Candidatus Neomarinimicrobiota bacterium]